MLSILKQGFCVCCISEAVHVFPCVLFTLLLEYTITMYDTKSRELRWNATYSDYASTLPDDDTKYSKILKQGKKIAL